jgi:hypothetical protein
MRTLTRTVQKKGARPSIFPMCQVRCIEQWKAQVMPVQQPFAMGVMMDVQNSGMVDEGSAEGLYMCGNQRINQVYDTDMLTNADRECQAIKNSEGFYRPGKNGYVVHPVTERQCESAAANFNSFQDNHELWFACLFKFYPSLAKPLDAATQAEFVERYRAAIPVAHDQDQLLAILGDFVLRMYTEKYITWTYWWRLEEALVEASEQQPVVDRHTHQAINVVYERITKIILNHVAAQPWAHEVLSNSNTMDVSTFRPTHEAGYW